jgi:group I intron endonuclease
METGLIYKITNQINNKVYIGLTIRTLEERQKQHLYGVGNGNGTTPIARAFLKYGKENFVFEIIEDKIPNEELDERERY